MAHEDTALIWVGKGVAVLAFIFLVASLVI
jgi:hypothetical protein